ncbi:hypothetical protein BTO30_12335 [Domibacillus antri]|uniref:Uncharacterized protein n=1 Tax=Domibacillus antri TaxID=1714264 RepID=A0A1Q8Q3G0_9BACI|nr:hypothetical protein [Domibacillus antri]OLN21880.1 hypothetical protein BTO30_12335 [Domibacillus antri]
MEFKLTIEAPGLEKAILRLADAIQGGGQYVSAAEQKTQDKPKAEPDETEKETPAETPKAENQPPADVEGKSEVDPPADSGGSEEPGITLDVLTTKTREFIQSNPAHREKLKDFLTEKGVGKVTELPESEYAAALELMGESV